MKKIISIIIIIVLIILSFSSIIFIIYKNKLEEKENLPFVWQAKYIWILQENLVDERAEDGIKDKADANEWLCFRKTFNIENKKDIKDILARIAADSKYWLYINDTLVVREGSVKRGEKENSTYYDEVDITKYLVEGENTISVLVWYFGRSSFSHIDSGKGGFIFQTHIGENIIISDDSWKVLTHPAYLKDHAVINQRLSESSIYFDARLDTENWYKKDFDDSTWENAIICGNAIDLPWGELISRDIPLFKFDEEIKEYTNFDKYKNYITTKDELIVLELLENIQFVPYLKINSKENLRIYITLDENYNEIGKEHRVTYITKEGMQEYESPAWINGNKVYYYIPAGVEIISLGYRETGFDTEMSGNFKSDDEFLNKLWNMANRTLYVNMRDNYMDCPDRERALWWGDASVSMEMAMYGLDTNANSLYEKSVRTLIGWKEGSLLMTVVPSKNSTLHLPVQMLLGITSMYNYYEYTGNKEFLEYVYPHVKEYLNNWTVSEDTGLVMINNYYALWNWGDSTGECDYFAIENAWYGYALDSIYKMAQELSKTEDIEELKQRVDKFYKAYNNYLWKDVGYQDNGKGFYDPRANAITVLSGIADESKYESITKVLLENTDNSPFMEKYILEALCKMGKIEEVEERIKLRYSEMVECKEEYSTLWEYWDKTTGSKNHAWSGGTLIIMSKYFAGISPLKSGYEEILIKPNFGILNNIETNVSTIKGDISLKASKQNEKLNIEINVPTKTLIAVEKISENPEVLIDNKVVYKDGKNKNRFNINFESEDEKYLYFYVENGSYNLESK